MSKYVINIKEIVKTKIKKIIRNLFGDVIIYVDPCNTHSENNLKRKEK